LIDDLELCCKIEDKRVHRYRFIDSEKEHYLLSLLCRVMRVRRSASYVYARRKSHVLSAAKDTVAEQVEAAFYLHRWRYGAQRLAAELKARGARVGRLQVRAMMRRQNLVAIQPRCFTPRSTDSRHSTAQPKSAA
jgi:hypothetical protein